MTSRNVTPFRYALEHPSGATHEEGLRYIGLIFNSILTTTKKSALTKRHRGWPNPFLICIQIFSIGQLGKKVEGYLISRLVTLKPAAAVWYSLVASIHNLACINEIQNCHGREVGGCWWRANTANTAVTSLRGNCITVQIYAFKWHRRIYVYSPT